MSFPDDTARSLEQWLNAYWRYLEPERLLFGDTVTLKSFIRTHNTLPDKVTAFACVELHSVIGGKYIRISTHEGLYICTVISFVFQKILNDKYPQFLEGIQGYNTKE